MRDLRNKIVLVTGAGRGLGREISLAFARAGSQLVCCDVDLSAAEDTAAQVRALGVPVKSLKFDVTSNEDALHLKEILKNEPGGLDVLVNNAGIAASGSFCDVEWERHHRTLEVNLAGVLRTTHALLPLVLVRPQAHVVNVASASALLALPRGASYAASKWGALGFTESLREELRLAGARNVVVTAVCPGFLSTSLFAGVQPPRWTPLLTPEYVAARIVSAVRAGREELLLPWTARLIRPIRGLLPAWAVRRLYDWFGVSRSLNQ